MYQLEPLWEIEDSDVPAAAQEGGVAGSGVSNRPIQESQFLEHLQQKTEYDTIREEDPRQHWLTDAISQRYATLSVYQSNPKKA